MKKTNVYIDGYNLYYGLLKGTPWKWLDLEAFAQALLGDGHEILSVSYFTSLVKPYPYDLEAVDHQKTYLHALEEMGRVKTVLGFYAKRKAMLPAYEEVCKACPTSDRGLLKVVKFEEKRSDVNIAVSMLLDAARTEEDCAALITGDSDQVSAIEAVRYTYGKRVLVFNPHETFSENLKRAASYYKNVPRDLPARCQLPDAIPVGTHGNFIRRPEAWRA